MKRHSPSRAVVLGAMAALVLLSAAAFVAFRWLYPGGVTMVTVAQTGFSVSYPSSWKVNGQLQGPSDVVLLIRDPHPTSSYDPGLIVRRTAVDPYPLDQDIPGLLRANQFRYPDIRVLRHAHISVHGAKEAVLVVSEAQVEGQSGRIVDIVVRTPANVAYHLQAVAPPALLSDQTIDAIVNGFRVS